MRRTIATLAAALLLSTLACDDETTTPADAAPDGATVDSAAGDDSSGDTAPDTVTSPDGPVTKPDGPVTKPDGPVTSPDGPSTVTDGPSVSPDMSTKKACDTLNASYLAALPAAKVCAPMLPVVQCTITRKNKLACPCSTHVNQTQVAAVAALDTLDKAFTALGCAKLYMCPAIPCPPIGKGVCQSSGGTMAGTCLGK